MVVEESDDNGNTNQGNDVVEDKNNNDGNDDEGNDTNDTHINDEIESGDKSNDKDDNGENTDSQQNIDSTMSAKYGPRSVQWINLRKQKECVYYKPTKPRYHSAYHERINIY